MRNFWGLLFILLGALLVMENLGLLAGLNIWDVFWPGALILLGLRQLYRGLRPARSSSRHSKRRRPENARTGRRATTKRVTIPLDGAGKARLQLDTPPGRLLVQGGAPAAVLLQGQLTGDAAVSTSMAGSTLSAHLQLAGPQPEAGEWVIDLSQIPTLTLALTGEAGPAHLDLRALRLHLLRLYLPEDTLVQLPADGGDTDVYLSGSGRYHLSVPAGVAVRVNVQSETLEPELDETAMPALADTAAERVFQAPNFGEAANRLRITVEPPVGALSVTLNPD